MRFSPTSQTKTPTVATETVRRSARQCVGAGSMVALLLVLTVMPGAAAFAAPEAVGHISILLHEVVRHKPDRDPREPRVTVAEREIAVSAVRFASSIPAVRASDVSPAVPASAPVFAWQSRCEAFAATPWSMDTPPPGC